MYVCMDVSICVPASVLSQIWTQTQQKLVTSEEL